MIITAFKGHVGNQFFQYTAARKIAHDSGTELKFDLTNWFWQRPYGREHDNSFCLQFFNIDYKVATKAEIDRFKKKGFLYYLERIFLPRTKRRYIWEKNWEFDEGIVGLKKKNVYLYGQFQSQKYFQGIEDIIRKELTFKVPPHEDFDRWAQKIQDCNSVSLHIRRNDFLRPDLQKVLYQCPPEYFYKAVSIIKGQVENPRLFVFSDDLEWVKQNLSFPFPTEYVSSSNFMDYHEIMLMGKCKHNIIANSTYSWWGAWFNENPDKIVVAPKNWLVDQKKNERYTEHLIPKSWITL